MKIRKESDSKTEVFFVCLFDDLEAEGLFLWWMYSSMWEPGLRESLLYSKGTGPRFKPPLSTGQHEVNYRTVTRVLIIEPEAHNNSKISDMSNNIFLR